jgi:hypothetical protein
LVVAALGSPAFVFAQEGGAILGTVSIPRAVRVDGKPLARGTYQIRLTAELPPPVVGQSPDAARYVEFVKAGKVVGREVATVVSNQEIAAIAESRRPGADSVKVEALKGNDYLRVWINRAGANYLIHLPMAA